MTPTIRHVDLGSAAGVAFEQGAAAWAIVLPGAGYSVQAPLLWYAREVALAEGRNVIVVSHSFDRKRDEPVRWVVDRAEAALAHVRAAGDSQPLLVTKSLTSLAAPLAADARLPAIWLTPLISRAGTPIGDQALAGLRAATAPQLLIGGAADPEWDGEVARSLVGAEVLSRAPVAAGASCQRIWH